MKFSERIGFLHPSKKRKLKELLDSYPNYIWEFPKNREQQKDFIKKTMLRKARVKKPSYIRVISNKKKNVLMLSSLLNDIFCIRNKWYESRSGQGTKYYEITINRKQSVVKALKHGLLNKREIIKLEG